MHGLSRYIYFSFNKTFPFKINKNNNNNNNNNNNYNNLNTLNFNNNNNNLDFNYYNNDNKNNFKRNSYKNDFLNDDFIVKKLNTERNVNYKINTTELQNQLNEMKNQIDSLTSNNNK